MVSGVVAISIGGFVVWQFGAGQSTKAPALVEKTMIEGAFEYMSDSQSITGTDTLATLRNLDRDIECTFKFKDDGMYSEGTGFFSDGNVRVDAIARTESDATYLSNIIMNSELLYIWGESTMGTFAVTMPVAPAGSSTAKTNEYLTADESVSYSCSPWNVDNSVFMPPAHLDFFDISQFMNGIPSSEMIDGMTLPSVQ